MNDTTLLVIIALMVATALAISFMRLWFVTNYDANLGNKVKGLGLNFDKLRKEVRTHYAQSSTIIRPDANIQADVSNMTIEDVAEQLGFDKKELNNPLIRPLAEKLFEKFKSGQLNQDEQQEQLPDL